MLQTITTLSTLSRITSSSYSFQPMIDSSIKTSEVGLCRSPAPAICSRVSLSKAIPEPNPPIVNEGRITTGKFNSCAAAKTCSIVWQIIDLADSPPIFSTIALKSSRFSPRSIAATSAPINLTLYLSRVPAWKRPIAALSAVCPPRVARTASGRSLAMIRSMNSGVIGSIYVASANSGSVMIVAGFEFTRITRMPSARKTRQA